MRDPEATQPPCSASPRTGLLLIAHGSRNPEANEDLFFVVDQFRQKETYPIVEGAFLELAEPSIEQAALHCIRQGARRVVLLPYFLSAGIHVQQDLSKICQVLGEHHPDVEFILGKPLGRHPLLLEVAAQRAREAEENRGA